MNLLIYLWFLALSVDAFVPKNAQIMMTVFREIKKIMLST